MALAFSLCSAMLCSTLCLHGRAASCLLNGSLLLGLLLAAEAPVRVFGSVHFMFCFYAVVSDACLA